MPNGAGVRKELCQRLLFEFALPLAFSWSASALDPGKALTQYVHRSWHTEDGLPQVSAMAIAQSSDGYIWIGTRNGLARFDGIRFTIFDKANTPEIRDSEIYSLAADHEGTLWIGTTAGLTSLRDGRFRAITSADGIPPGAILSLYVSRSGNVWIGCSGVAYERRGRRFFLHKMPVNADVLALAESDGAIWAATSGGLVRIRDEATTLFTTANGLPDNKVLSVAFANGDLWIGTAAGAARMHRGTILRDVPDALRDHEVWAIARDRDDSLWFGTRRGVVRLSSRGVEVDTSGRDGLSSNYVDALYEDREGTLWVGTQLDGVNQICGSSITTWSSTEGLGGDAVWTIAGDANGKTYVGTEGGGIFVIENGHAAALQPAHGLTSKTIISLALARDGTLWAGSYDRGLFSLRNGKWASISKKDGLPSDMINAIEPDGATLWVGTALGLCRIDGRRITTFHTSDGLPSDVIDAIHRDRRGRLWAATENGVSVFDGGRFNSRIGSQLLPQQASYSLYEDAAGGMWAGMHRGLLHVAPNGRIQILTSREGLAQDEIRSIQQDRAGDFWLTCSKGVFRVSRRDLERGQITSRLLGPGDGMKHGECTYGSSPTSWAAPDGSIWFATSRGAARLDPTLASRGVPPSPVLVERLLVDGKPAPIERQLDLQPGTGKLEFHFTSPSFAAPKQIQYRYRLDGYDDNWIDAGNERVARYTHIPPGSYRFRVSAHDGRSGGDEARVAVVVRPTFAQTGWFRALVVTALLLAGVVLYLRRVQRIRTQYAAVIAERNRIAREFHDTLAQLLVGIGFHLDAAIDGLADDPRLRAIEEELGRARKLARQSLSDTRRALLDMRPDVLERGDLAAAVIAVGDETKKASAIDVTVQVIGEPRRFDARAEQHILRIAQEGITNAVRHSGAQKIRVELCFGIEEIALSISDNGSGPRSLTDSGPLRLGFIGIRERAAEIGGRLSVTSRPGEGVTVMLTVPLRDRRPTLATRILAWSGRR